jgi:DNA-binding MarR family transcriptional regulator
MSEFLDLHSVTSKSLRALVDTAVRRHGLRVGQDLLMRALAQDDGRTPGELAAALNVTTPTITTTANRLESVGMLTRQRDEHDNRLVRLWLTDHGRELLRPIETVRARIERQVTANLTGAERSELIRLLSVVQASADAALERTPRR